MRLPASIVAATLALAAALPAACTTDCVRERCTYPALLLTVHDAVAGDFLPEATLTQAGTPLSTELTAAFCSVGRCTHAVTPAVDGPVTVSLTSYKNATVAYTARHDDCANLVRQAIDVALVSTSSPAPAAVSDVVDLGAGCNIR